MKTTVYFLVLLLAIVAGFLFLPNVLFPFMWGVEYIKPYISGFLYIALWAAITLLQLGFAVFLCFRTYICFKARGIVLPSRFSGRLYTANAVFVSLVVVATAGTFVLHSVAQSGSVSGVPLGLLLLPSGLLALVTVLQCEIPEIKQWRSSTS